MKLKDVNDRRMRWAPPQPPDTGLELKPRDILIFELLNRHGPLPATYLYEMTRHLARDKTKFTERLRDLYHGYLNSTQEHITYLSRPGWQGKYKDRPIIYDLTPYAEAALERRGIPVIKRKREHPLHRFMGATVSASLALYIQARRLEYHDRNRILAHKNTPQETRDAKYPFTVTTDSGKIEPDDFFAVQDPFEPKKSPNFYAVEYDRSTETIEDGKALTSFERKLKHCIEAIEARAYQKHLGITDKFKVLTITNNARHKRGMQKCARDLRAPQGKLLFAHVDGFTSDEWSIPPLMLVTFEDANGNPVELG